MSAKAVNHYVTYTTMNDTYTKSFKALNEAIKFANMIAKLYPGQHPTVDTH